MKLSDFDFDLPEQSIAQTPAEPRDHARLMVINREKKSIEHHHFYELPNLLPSNTCLVRNNSKVVKSRIKGTFETGAEWELFYIKSIDNHTGHFLVRPGKKFPKEKQLELTHLGEKLRIEVKEVFEDGTRYIHFQESNRPLSDILQIHGELPLPPYITARDGNEAQHYQTVYASPEGSLAAPTAGLHFTEDTFHQLAQKHIPIFDITLHVGLGTFLPVKVDHVQDHTMHYEDYLISQETWGELKKSKDHGKKLCAVGTTTTRVLEHVWSTEAHQKQTLEGSTNIFIYPPYTFKAVDHLLTNFHLPKSTLIMLVSAFIGDTTFTLHAYEEAVKMGYRFYSYGDAMLIL